MLHATVVCAIIITVMAFMALCGNDDAKEYFADCSRKGGGCLTFIGTVMCVIIAFLAFLSFILGL